MTNTITHCESYIIKNNIVYTFAAQKLFILFQFIKILNKTKIVKNKETLHSKTIHLTTVDTL